jgi:methylsterol monooxygenase
MIAVAGGPGQFLFAYTVFLNLSIFAGYTVVYWLDHPAIEQYKTNAVPWPWKTDPNWKRIIPKFACSYFMNQFVINFIAGYLQEKAMGPLNFLTEQQKIPAFSTFFCQVLFFTLLEDMITYFVHRMFHHPLLYRRFHKQHHEIFNTLAYSYEYINPIEYAVSDLISNLGGPVLLGDRAHMFPVIVFMALQNLESSEAHSGYSFPFPVAPTRHLPFAALGSFHNHHHLINIGNYSNTFMIWDAIFGTCENYYEHREQLKIK